MSRLATTSRERDGRCFPCLGLVVAESAGTTGGGDLFQRCGASHCPVRPPQPPVGFVVVHRRRAVALVLDELSFPRLAKKAIQVAVLSGNHWDPSAAPS